MYYIYHIEGIKIGCTNNIERRVNQQGFTSYEILEEHIDIFEASNREIELQKKYGYRVDNIPYFKSVKQWGATAGTIGGKQTAINNKKLGILPFGNDKEKQIEYAKLGWEALNKKYSKEWFSERGRKGGGNINSIIACSKAVIQLDKNDNIISDYPSVTDASKKTGISLYAISNCINGKTKTSGGFKWIIK